MKKALLILSIISILFLGGCNSTENNNTLPENSNTQQEENNNTQLENSNTQQEENLNTIPKLNNYIYTNSSTELIKEDLKYSSLERLELAKNEIFARYGHDFSSEKLNTYFNTRAWYNKIEGKKVAVSDLNEIERKNVEYIDSFINAKLDKVFNQEPTQTFDSTIILNNTSPVNLLKINQVDYENLPIGEYKYVLGKFDLLNKTYNMIFTFSVDSIDELNHRMYSNPQVYLTYENAIKFNFVDEWPWSSSPLSTDNFFTEYNDYLLVQSFEPFGSFSTITLYDSNLIDVFSTIGTNSRITIDNNKLLLSSYDEPSGYIEESMGTPGFYRVDYELIEKDGKFELNEIKIDYEDKWASAQS